jgi:hypothetical protein
MQVEVIKATIEQKPLLANLLELYAQNGMWEASYESKPSKTLKPTF